MQDGDLVKTQVQIGALGQVTEGLHRHHEDAVALERNLRSFGRNVTWHLHETPVGSVEPPARKLVFAAGLIRTSSRRTAQPLQHEN